jgi:hypothetical protein
LLPPCNRFGNALALNACVRPRIAFAGALSDPVSSVRARAVAFVESVRVRPLRMNGAATLDRVARRARDGPARQNSWLQCGRVSHVTGTTLRLAIPKAAAAQAGRGFNHKPVRERVGAIARSACMQLASSSIVRYTLSRSSPALIKQGTARQVIV